MTFKFKYFSVRNLDVVLSNSIMFFDNTFEANNFLVDLTDCFGKVSCILDSLLGSVGICFLNYLDGLIYSFGMG